MRLMRRKEVCLRWGRLAGIERNETVCSPRGTPVNTVSGTPMDQPRFQFPPSSTLIDGSSSRSASDVSDDGAEGEDVQTRTVPRL